jgi:hypothetical protein
VVDSEADFQRDIVQTKFRGWRLLHLRAH